MATQFSNPALTASQAAATLAEAWGITGALTPINSLQDQNFHVLADDGRELLLRIANGHWTSEAIEMETSLLRALGEADTSFAVPAPLRALTGGDIVEAHGHRLRLLTWLPGTPLASVGHLTDAMLHDLGRLAGQSCAALETFDHPAANREFQWDTRQALAMVPQLAEPLDAAQRALLDKALEPMRALEPTLTELLPRQVIHADITDENVVGRRVDHRRFAATGLIDFGDVVSTWRVCEAVATAASGVSDRSDDVLEAALHVLGGFDAEVKLEEAEIAAFWPLLLARMATCAASSTRLMLQSEANSYVVRTNRADWIALRALLAVHPDVAHAAARVRCGLPAMPEGPDLPRPSRLTQLAHPVAAETGPTKPAILDLSVTSDLLVDGVWHEPDALAEIVPAGAVGRWGEVRLTAAGRPAHEAAPTLHLGVDLFLAADTPVHAPLGGEVAQVGDREVTIACPLPDGPDVFVRLAGIVAHVAEGRQVPAGEVVGRVAADATSPLPPHVHVQLARAMGLPGLGDPRYREAWLALCPDPSPLLGVVAAAEASTDRREQRKRRERVLAGAQGLYYDDPPQIVRGWRQLLYDADGRAYLDMVNNVAVVGHSHPRVTAAATRQLQLLNTNSRFLYDKLTEYAERLVELLPPELDTVFLVNTGSEAVDLAVQLARIFTRRHDLVTVTGGYHGWTQSVFDACTSPQDNPTWRDTIPPYIHPAEQPDPYRGAHGDDADGYVASVLDACASAEAHGGVAAFLSETLLGNQGGVVPPKGYVAAAYAAVRAAGGVCIADEVQVGYGRTGESFWAFESEGVVPDIVTAAKATGNGQPVGVVACRREIADALGRRASFFSSTGGGPVSCAIGLAVLDILRDEGLQDNAKVVGDHLRSRLELLRDQHALVGAVHGRGLYLGVDLVRNRESREPAVEETLIVCERMRQLGVIIRPTGDHYNVLKVKPPLCLTRDDADLFVDTLDAVLQSGIA